MKNIILNFIIIILSLLIIACLGYVGYCYFLTDTYNVNFELNGVKNIENDMTSCNRTLSGCVVVMPNLTRDDGEVLGYSLSKDDSIARYKVGDKVLIDEDTVFYAVSYKSFNIHIEKNGVDFLEKSDIKCNAYNLNTSCRTVLPDFNKIGYQNAGYSEKKDLAVKTASEYFPLIEFEFNRDITLYPRYTSMRDDGRDYVYKNGNVFSINGTFVEFENGISQDIIDKYKKFLEEINKYAPFLFVGEKINVLSKDTLINTWVDSVLGICYGSSIMGFPLSRTIDVYYNSSRGELDNYRTLVHEMAHAFDMFYGYAANKRVPEVMDGAKASAQGGGIDAILDKMYGVDRISRQDDIVNLYNKYKSTKKVINRGDGYAYQKKLEFIAEAVSFYYMKYYLKTKNFDKIEYTDELKKTIEKYICIANNNYDKNKCN